MTNTYAKYCPNVWLAKCDTEHHKGDIIQVANKYGKEADCEIHNLVVKNANGYFYSITRCDGLNRQTYAQKRAEKYATWAQGATNKSDAYFEKSQSNREFLSLGEPIKIGHHSEARHRKLLEKNHNAMRNCVELADKAKAHDHKAEYWESQTNKIDLSMPESEEYFQHLLEKSQNYHAELKADSTKRAHSMSLSYAGKEVKDIKVKIETARILWGIK